MYVIVLDEASTISKHINTTLLAMIYFVIPWKDNSIANQVRDI